MATVWKQGTPMVDQRSFDQTPEWYRDGLRFQCTQCGNCCTGPPGAVWFDDEEAATMATALGMTPENFRRKWARRLHGRWSLREHLTEFGWDCVFLERSPSTGKAGCRLYGARPGQCRTWPFWHENLSSPEARAAARRETPCPGMGEGKLVPLEQIRIQRDS